MGNKKIDIDFILKNNLIRDILLFSKLFQKLKKTTKNFFFMFQYFYFNFPAIVMYVSYCLNNNIQKI